MKKIPDPDQIMADIEKNFRSLLRRYRTVFFIQQNIVPFFSALLPGFDWLARLCTNNIRFLRTTHLTNNYTVTNPLSASSEAKKFSHELNFVTANVLQGVQGVGKDMMMSRFWNSIFFEKVPNPRLKNVFHKDIIQSFKRIFSETKIDVLAVQEIFCSDVPKIKKMLRRRGFEYFESANPTNLFFPQYNVASLLTTQKKIAMRSVTLSPKMQKYFNQAKELSWGLNLSEIKEHKFFVINLHAPLIAPKKQIFWNRFMLFLQDFLIEEKKIILLGDFNASPQEIKKNLSKKISDFFICDLHTFHMEKPPIAMKLDNFVMIGFKHTSFQLHAQTYDIGSDHLAVKANLQF